MSTPVAAPARAHRGTWRWLVALAATALLVVSGSGLVAFAQSGAGASKGPAFVPADAPIYLVARLDMPDGQVEAVAQFMTAFPGFADAASFDMKATQAVEGLLAEATGGAVSFSDLQSFATGEVGLAMSNIAEAAMADEDPAVLVGIAISDRAAAEAFVDLMIGDDDDLVETPYGTTSILSDDETAVAVHDEWVLLSQTVEQVQTGIDVLEGGVPSLADDPGFTTAFARVPPAHLGALYMDIQSFASFIDLVGEAASGQMGMGFDVEELKAQLPIDMTAYLAAGPDRMTLEAFITPSAQTQVMAVGESELATRFPGDTQLYVETRELGTVLESALGGLLEMMEEEQAQQVAPIESILGEPLPTFLDFVSDASVGASVTSDGLWVGMAAEVTDEEVAAIRIDRILSYARIFAANDESGVTVAETTVGDATVTVITLPIDSESMGMPVDIGNTISVTVSDGTLLLGTGDFVESALTQAAADSLASSSGYTDALGEETTNSGVLYANVGSLLTAVDPLISMMVPEWQDIQPYATAIDRFIAVGSADADLISARMTVYVDS